MQSAAPPQPRVIFVNRYFFPDQSATSRMLTDLARGLVQEKYDVQVVCSRQLYDVPRAKLAPSEQAFGVTVHRIATTHFGRARLLGRAIDYASFYISCTARLAQLVKRRSIVIAKTDPPLISLVCALIVKLKGAILVNWQQDVFPETASVLGASPLPHWVDSLVRRVRDASLRAAHINVVIGVRMLQYFLHNGIPAAQLCLIENWADAEPEGAKPATQSALRHSLGLADRFVVGYSGNLGRAHEFETLLNAAQELRSEQGIIFLIIGGGAKMPALKQAVRDKGLTSFRFLPYQPRENLHDSLAAADVHIASLLPQLEGFVVPSKIYGILAAARPVVFVGDPCGELGELIRAADCGAVIQVADFQDLAATLVRLRGNPAVRAAMGQRARALFQEKYDCKTAVAKWATALGALYRKPAAIPRAPAAYDQSRVP